MGHKNRRGRTRKGRRGASLLELVIAIGLLGTITTMTVTLISLSTTGVAKQKEAIEYQRGVDTFLYNLLIELKSAESIMVSGDPASFQALQIIGYDSSVVTYEANNLRGSIYRNKAVDPTPLVTNIHSCSFHEEDDATVTITLAMSETESVTYTMRCGF